MNVCRYQRHWRLDSNKIHILDLMIESRNWNFLCIYTTQCQIKPMKSKCYNIQVSFSSCEKFIGNICWLANLFVLNLAFGWTIFLQIEKWVKCHLLLKCGLKTSSYDIWFFCALLGTKFWIFEAFMRYLWVFMIPLNLFLNSYCNLFIWVFGRFSCNIWDFWIFIWAMIQN